MRTQCALIFLVIAMGRTVDRILAEIDLIEYMSNCGYTPYPISNGKYYGLKEHSSVRIYPETNTYFHPGTGNGDPRRLNVINFAEWYYRISNDEAIKMLAKELNGNPSFKKSNVNREVVKRENKPFTLPDKATGKYNRLYAYLIKTRCLSRTVVNDMVKRNYLYQDARGNATFVGYYEGQECFCFQRGCSDEIPKGYTRAFTKIIEGSDFEHAWLVENGSNKLFVTEAAIDNMSIMTLFEKHNDDPKGYDYLATCGPSMKSIINYVNNHPDTEVIYLAFDNDEPGNKYRTRAAQALRQNGYSGKIINKPPYSKDFNEDLKLLSQHNGAITPDPTIQNNNSTTQNLTIERNLDL